MISSHNKYYSVNVMQNVNVMNIGTSTKARLINKMPSLLRNYALESLTINRTE